MFRMEYSEVVVGKPEMDWVDSYRVPDDVAQGIVTLPGWTKVEDGLWGKGEWDEDEHGHAILRSWHLMAQ